MRAKQTEGVLTPSVSSSKGGVLILAESLEESLKESFERKVLERKVHWEGEIMLRNKFRRFTGGLILFTFLIAIGIYIEKTWGNPAIWGALGWGMTLLALFGLVLWVAYRADRRLRNQEQER
jgi:hypothetical protein